MGYAGTNERPPLVDLIRRSPMLGELREGTLEREELERRLDVSTATGYRLTGWFEKRGLVTESDRGFTLTAAGEAIAAVTSTFEATVRTTLRPGENVREPCLDVVRLAPALAAFRRDPLDRHDLQRRLAVSKTTSHRLVRSLRENDLIERSGATYELTDAGKVIATAASAFEANVRTALWLAPVMEAMHGTHLPLGVEAFADSTATSAEHGDPYAPLVRFISLLEDTETVRGVNVYTIAPSYIAEMQHRIIDGMHTELIAPPAVSADILEHYPERCAAVCASGYLSNWIHTDLPPYALVIFTDRVGVGVCDSTMNRLRMLVDTDSPTAREWAERVYESYRGEAVPLKPFTEEGLREALAAGEAATGG